MNRKRVLHPRFVGVGLVAAIGMSVQGLPQSLAETSSDVMFQDIVVQGGTGLSYQRSPSKRDDLLDQLKAKPVLQFNDFPFVPLKSRGAPGVAVFDYDDDGDLDLFVTNGPGTANSLFANQFVETGELFFVDFAQHAGVAAPEWDAAGVCYGDIDNDGDSDLYVLVTGELNRLYENQGNGQFRDITEVSQAGGGQRYPAAASMGDVNGDGLLDIVVGNTTTTWDNRLAIFEPFAFNDHNQLFINQGDNVFVDASEESGIQDLAGLPSEVPNAAGITWAIAMVDYDLDGDVDIVAADDQGGGVPPAALGGVDRGLIHVMRNDGTGRFTDVTVQANTNRPGGWMGLAFGDLNADGYMDMFVTNIGDYVMTEFPRPVPYELGESSSRWFLGQPDGSFSDPGVGSLAASSFGWGTVIEDYDNDSDLDIVYYGGGDGALLYEFSNPGVILRNDGSGVFDYDSVALSLSTDHSRRAVQGVASGDLNQDGFVDFVSVSSFDMPTNASLMRYPTQWGSVFDETAFFFPSFSPIGPGQFQWSGVEPDDGSLSVEVNSGDNGNGWVTVKLVGASGLIPDGKVNRDGIGAVVEFKPKGGKRVMRPVLGGASYASQDSLTAHFGMNDARRGTVEVLWPGGVRNRLHGARWCEDLVFPEIPYSYDDLEISKRDYKKGVKKALRGLVNEGVIPRRDANRFFTSAIRAFKNYRKHHKHHGKHDR